MKTYEIYPLLFHIDREIEREGVGDFERKEIQILKPRNLIDHLVEKHKGTMQKEKKN